jgi:hypothetical protein
MGSVMHCVISWFWMNLRRLSGLMLQCWCVVRCWGWVLHILSCCCRWQPGGYVMCCVISWLWVILTRLFSSLVAGGLLIQPVVDAACDRRWALQPSG